MRKANRFNFLFAIFLFFLLDACRASPALFSSTDTEPGIPLLQIVIVSKTATLSPTSMMPIPMIGFDTVVLTNTPSPIQTIKTPTPGSTPSFMPSPTEITPTTRPTPTRGLPPKATLGKPELCPAPTHEFVPLELLGDPADYEQPFLDFLKANGNIQAFKHLTRRK